MFWDDWCHCCLLKSGSVLPTPLPHGGTDHSHGLLPPSSFLSLLVTSTRAHHVRVCCLLISDDLLPPSLPQRPCPVPNVTCIVSMRPPVTILASFWAPQGLSPQPGPSHLPAVPSDPQLPSLPLCIVPRRARAGPSLGSFPGLLYGILPASVPQFLIWNTGGQNPDSPRRARTIAAPPTLFRLGGEGCLWAAVWVGRAEAHPPRSRSAGGSVAVAQWRAVAVCARPSEPQRPRAEQMAGEASGRVSCCYLSLMTRSVNFVGNTPSCLCMPPALITVIEL